MPNPTERIRLVVLFGGVSAEHEVSCVTAAHVLQATDPTRYDVIPIGITRGGTWVRNDDAIAALAAGAQAIPDALEPVGTTVDPLPAMRPGTGLDELPVVVFPLLHGPHGEDGTVQGMLELAGVPYVGTGVLGSSLCMDKAMAKRVADQTGIPQCRWIEHAASDAETPAALAERAAQELGFPIFVKPANMGSSIGITKAHDEAELAQAIDDALVYDEVLVLEEGVAGRELEVGVLGDLEPEASVAGEILPGAEFYDYDDKYLTGAAELRIPADLPSSVRDEIRTLAVRTFSVMRCSGLARIDFFYEPDGRGVLLNEVNTIPGFTPSSMYPKLWEASGVSYGALIDRLVALAIQRHDRRGGFSTKR